MEITKKELLENLRRSVSWREWKRLREDPQFPVSKHNRESLLEMKDKTAESGNGRIAVRDILRLRKLLSDFLSEYMKEQPQWWKWIILSCIYLTYVAERPMHPLDVVGIKTETVNGKKLYKCPMKSREKGTVCDYCVCDFLDE